MVMQLAMDPTCDGSPAIAHLQQIKRLEVPETKMCKWTCGFANKEEVTNKQIRDMMKVENAIVRCKCNRPVEMVWSCEMKRTGVCGKKNYWTGSQWTKGEKDQNKGDWIVWPVHAEYWRCGWRCIRQVGPGALEKYGVCYSSSSWKWE